jgi:hypothetical protein
MGKSITFGAILGGLVLFIWSALSWIALPLHTRTMTGFKDDKAIANAIRANAEKSGVYYSPKDQADMATGPLVYAVVRREGMTSIAKEMGTGLLIDILCAGLMTWLLLQVTGRSFISKVGVVLVVALIAALMDRLGDWNWWGYPIAYTVVLMLDIIVGWLLAGLVVARFAVRQTSAT